MDSCCDPLTLEMVNDDEYLSLQETIFKALWENRATLPEEMKLTAIEGLRILKGLREGWGADALSLAYNAPDYKALAIMEANVFAFANSKVEARLAAASDLILNKEKLKINSFSEFKKAAFDQVELMNTTYLRTEYDLAIAVGQNGSAFQRFLAEQDQFPFVQYQTVGDSNVRSEHALLDGRIFNIKDSDARNLWPPNGYNCRCEMVQYIGEPDEVSSGKTESERLAKVDKNWEKRGWNINRGDTMEVFTRKQFYSSTAGLPQKLSHNKATGSFKKLFKGLDAPIDKSITKANVGELFRNDVDGNMGFADYFNRKMVLKPKTFKAHTTDKYIKMGRHQLFPLVEKVLATPDEVFINQLGKTGKEIQYRYIKYYADKAVVVETSASRVGSFEVKTWYQLIDEDKRSGIAIK